VRSIKVTTTVA